MANAPILSTINYKPPSVYGGGQNGLSYPNGSPQFQILDNGSTVNGKSTTVNNTSTTAGVNDASTIAAYQQAINNAQGSLGRQDSLLNSGYSGIEASYQNAINQLLGGKNIAERNYGDTKTQAGVDYSGAKNTIGANAGQAINGLQRLLGSRGAGGSSAYLQAAPGAVGRGATLQRADVANQFGANNRALDTNWNDYLQQYTNQVSSAGSQRDQQRQGLQQSVDQNRASILQTLASLSAQQSAAQGGNATGAAQPYLDQANGILNNLSNYNVAPINYQTQAYQAPSLASYQTNANPTAKFASSVSDYVSPFLQTLLGKKQPATA